MKIKSVSARQTQAIAKKLAKHLLKESHFKYALLLALSGNLGSGKTTFVQGFLIALGVRGALTSPTFVLIKKYKISKTKFQINSKNQELNNQNHQPETKNYKFAYHVDAYRIKKPAELLHLGLKEILADPQNIVLIEWAEKIKKLLPKNAIWMRFEHVGKENQRIIKIGNIKRE